MDLSVLNQISYGMYVIATRLEEKNVGCFVNTVTQVTAENPMIIVCVNKKNYTNEAIRKSKKFSVSILSEKTNAKVIGTFGFVSSREIDKFAEFEYEMQHGLPVLKENIVGYLICELIQVIDAETHDIFMARVIETKKNVENEEDAVPMTYRYYHEVIKGKAPKTAPTYIKEEVKSSSTIQVNVKESKNEILINKKEKGEDKMENQEFKKYQCTICGYIYDDSKEAIKFEELPDDWKCPLCGVGKSLFKEI